MWGSDLPPDKTASNPRGRKLRKEETFKVKTVIYILDIFLDRPTGSKGY